MDWSVYNTIDGMKQGADLRKAVILESVQEVMLISAHSRGEIPQAQFESLQDKLTTLKSGVAKAGKFMRTLLAAGVLGASLAACAGNPGLQVDPLKTAEFSVQADRGMTDEQIAELGQECLVLITQELDPDQHGRVAQGDRPVQEDCLRRAPQPGFREGAEGARRGKGHQRHGRD